jgi:hypothetical protein
MMSRDLHFDLGRNFREPACKNRESAFIELSNEAMQRTRLRRAADLGR